MFTVNVEVTALNPVLHVALGPRRPPLHFLSAQLERCAVAWCGRTADRWPDGPCRRRSPHDQGRTTNAPRTVQKALRRRCRR